VIASACCIDKTASRVQSQILVSSLKENKEIGQKEDIEMPGTWRSGFKSYVVLRSSA